MIVEIDSEFFSYMRIVFRWHGKTGYSVYLGSQCIPCVTVYTLHYGFATHLLKNDSDLRCI